jgi:hypothetical protein
MSGPEDNPADDVQPTKEEYEAWESELPPLTEPPKRRVRMTRPTSDGKPREDER